MKAQRVYECLPVFLQNFVCSLEGHRIKSQRYSGRYSRLAEEVNRRGTWRAERIADFSDKRLRVFIKRCCESTPFYRQLLREMGAHPNDIFSWESFEKFPILLKQEVSVMREAFVSETRPISKRMITHTSGTTGAGLRFVTTRLSIQEQWAVWWRYRSWHGIYPGTWCGYFGGRTVVPVSKTDPPFHRINYASRQILFSGYHMSAKNLKHYVDTLQRRRPPWLHGYPSLLSLIAGYIFDTRSDLGYQVRWITTGAETLLPGQAAMIERSFGVKPRQHYGLAEGVANISECELGSLHVDEDFAAVEFVPTSRDGQHRIVGTNFANPAFPLVRYDTGDIATLSDQQCACGRPGRTVKDIDGRKEDYVLLRNGAKLGRMDHIFKDMVNIREAQIYQKEPGQMIIRIVRGTNYHEIDETTLLKEAYMRVGTDTKVDVAYVDSLERSLTGKLRFVVSEIPEGQLTAAV